MKHAVFFAILFTSLTSQADVLFSVEHAISIDTFKAAQKAFLSAKNRDAEMMKFPVIVPIHLGKETPTSLTLSCPAMRPQADGEGCSIYVLGNRGRLGQISIHFQKSLSESALSNSIQKLESIFARDPNQVEAGEHQQVGNPFSASTDGTHVFCVSAGVQPDKIWTCRLSTFEAASSKN